MSNQEPSMEPTTELPKDETTVTEESVTTESATADTGAVLDAERLQ